MNINHLINELIEYGVSNNLIENDDRIYCSNKLLEFFGVEDFTEEKIFYSRPVHEILEDCMTYAGEAGLLTDPTTTEKDLYDTKIMGLITPPPSSVRRLFNLKYRENPQAATEFYYNFSKATNYIRTDRIKRDEKWVTDTDFGALDITINLSKPEKDPRDIAAAGKAKKSGYPSCLLCKENEGYAGHISHPARQNHRVIPIRLCGEVYNLQYSPYVYYNEHCIIFNDEHIPMKIDRLTFAKLLDFVRQFPHYTAGSNADLPISVTESGIFVSQHPHSKVFVAVSIIALHLLRESYTLFPSATTILFRLEQPENALSEISVTDAGIMMLSRLVQPENESLIIVTESGMVMLVRFLHPRNVSYPISATELPMVMLVRFSQSRNALSPISVTELGMTMLVRPVQPEKALSPIFVTELPIVMLVSPVQRSKAPSPISVTESGMTTFFRFGQ